MHGADIPEEYPGTATTDRGETVTSLEATPLEDGEHLLRVWTEDRDKPLELALTPTQVRQWEAQLDICETRVDIHQSGRPDLDDTVLTSTIGKTFHDPEPGACAATNAYDTVIDHEMTVREAVEDGYSPCHHCYEFDGWDPADLWQEVQFSDS